MRFIGLASVALSGRWFAHGLTVMGNYEIRPAGDDGSSSAFGKVLTVEPFVAETYFESVSTVPDIATFELFTNAADGKPCSTGTAISNSTFNVSTGIGPKYTKTGSNSQIFAAQYSIPDVTTTPAYDNGKVNLCARIGIKKEYDSSSSGTEYVSYVDTLLVVNVDFTAKFSNFSQTVNISATTMGNLTQNVTKLVAVEAVLCAKGASALSSYKIGQDFSICVSPKDSDITVSNFTNVTCENSASSRQLVMNTVPDTLTTTSLNVTGYLNASGSAVGGDGAVFSSVVTAGYFGQGDTFFTCSGEVSLSYPVPVPCTSMGSILIAQTTHKGVYGLPMCVNEFATSSTYINQGYLTTANLTTNVPNGYEYKAIPGGLNWDHMYAFEDFKSKVKVIGNNPCKSNALYIQPNTFNLSQIDYSATFSVGLVTKRSKSTDMIYTCFAVPNITTAEQAAFIKWGPGDGSTYYEYIGGFKLTATATLDYVWNWYCPKKQSEYVPLDYFKNIQQEGLVCNPTDRRLTSVSFTDKFKAGALVRKLQESNGAPRESESFAASVGLSENGLDGLTASAVFYGGWTASLGGIIVVFLTAM